MNTHDTATFASFWRGLDVRERVRLGLLDRSLAGPAREQRLRLLQTVAADLRRGAWIEHDEPTTREALWGCLAFLAESPAEVVLVQLEDLWLETRAQNVPGTSSERSNWRGRMRLSLEELAANRKVLQGLRVLDRRRKNGAENGS